MNGDRFEYNCIVEFFERIDDFPLSGIIFDRLTFEIPKKLYLRIIKYSKKHPLTKANKEGRKIIDSLYKIAFWSFSNEIGVVIKNIYFMDLYLIEQIKNRLINKPVVEEILLDDDCYSYGKLTDNDTECYCRIRLAIEDKIITNVKDIEFFEVIDGEEHPYRYMYQLAFEYIDFLDAKYNV